MEKYNDTVFYSKPFLAPLTASVTLIVCKSFLVLVDAGSSFRHVERLKEEISTISNLPIKYLIITHDHYDHIFGYNQFAGQYILAPLDFATKHRDEEVNIITVDDTYYLDDEDLHLVIRKIPTSHIENHLCVEVTNSNILIIGDALQSYLTANKEFVFYSRKSRLLIDFIRNMKMTAIFTGHQGVLNEEAYNMYLNDLELAMDLSYKYDDYQQIKTVFEKNRGKEITKLQNYFIQGFLLANDN